MTEATKQPNTIHTTDKQYYVLKCMVQKIYSLIFGGSRCLMPDTLVLTSQGYKEIKDIQIGDKVQTLGKSGKIESKKVTNKFINKHSQIVDVVFVNGTKITCSSNHRLLFNNGYYTITEIAKILDGTNIKKELSGKTYGSAREIGFGDIKYIEIIDYSGDLIDIEVEDNHNFFITKDNFISHNSGKSFIILLRMLSIASKHPCRQLVVRFHFTDVKKSVVLETLPKVAAMMGITYHLNQQDWFITIQNGTKEPSEIWFGGIDEGRGLDRILGKEYLNIWFNEASEITYNAYQTVITRLAQKVLLKDRKTGKQLYKQEQVGIEIKDGKEVPVMRFVMKDGKKVPRQVTNRVFLDENPPKKSHWTYKLFFDHIEPESRTLLENPEEYGAVQVNPLDNSENIDEGYVKRLNAMPPKLRTRFLLGDFSDDIMGAMFTENCINRNRLLQHPTLKQIVISIDPATTSKSTSDETGIIVVGKCENDRGYLLEDKSGIYKPAEWSDIAVKLFYKYDADCIVAEINQGGDMCKAVINNADPNVPVKTVHATKGKMLRAEPISYLYEEDRISHVGGFTDAENEMTSFTGAEGEKSPNRLDAIVHGFTYLFPIGKSSDTEYFNRERVRFFDKYNMEGAESFGYIRITNADNYSFSMLCLKIKDKNIFLTDVLFNDFLPFSNLDSVKDIAMKNGLSTIYIECPKTHALFTSSVKNLSICSVRGINLETSEENKILIESQFIREKFSFQSEPEDAQYKDFMRQLHGYTSIADKDQVYAPSALAGISGIIKKMYRENL